VAEDIHAQSGVIHRWNGAKRGKTMISAKTGSLVLTSERLVFLSTGVNVLVGSGSTGSSIQEGLQKKGSLEIPLDRITSCELTTMYGVLTLGFVDASGAEAWTTFAQQVGGMPDGAAWKQAIDHARAARNRA
jgi:hypothetical protein